MRYKRSNLVKCLVYFDISDIYNISDIGKHRGMISRIVYRPSYAVQLRIVISAILLSGGKRNSRGDDEMKTKYVAYYASSRSQLNHRQTVWYGTVRYDDKLKIHVVLIDIILCSI